MILLLPVKTSAQGALQLNELKESQAICTAWLPNVFASLWQLLVFFTPGLIVSISPFFFPFLLPFFSYFLSAHSFLLILTGYLCFMLPFVSSPPFFLLLWLFSRISFLLFLSHTTYSNLCLVQSLPKSITVLSWTIHFLAAHSILKATH